MLEITNQNNNNPIQSINTCSVPQHPLKHLLSLCFTQDTWSIWILGQNGELLGFAGCSQGLFIFTLNTIFICILNTNSATNSSSPLFLIPSFSDALPEPYVGASPDKN